MGENPDSTPDAQPQHDQARPPEQEKPKAADGGTAYNQRVRESQGDKGKGGRSGRSGQPYTSPDPLGDLYDMATPPPKIGEGQGKPIPVGDLGDLIPKREPPASATRLRDHKPSATPEKKGSPVKQDKVDMTFPPEVIRLSDTSLSKTEAAERQKVASPKDAVGFGFDKDKPTKAYVQHWHDGLSPQEKVALKDPDTIIHITATCSKPGKPGYNQGLSERRAASVAKILEKEYGVDPSRIKPVGLGEDPAQDNNPDTPDNQDDHQERVALIHFEKKVGAPTKEAGEAGGRAGDQGRPPEPPEKYTPEQGIKDTIKDVIINLISEAVGAAKTVVDYAVQFITAVGEAHEKNKQAAIARGVQFSLSIMSSDVKSDNPHVREGKPYTADELAKRIRENGPLNSKIQREMPYLKVENSEADKQFKKGMGVVARNINQVLTRAKTPEHRRQVIDSFVKEGTKRISQAYKLQSKRR